MYVSRKSTPFRNNNAVGRKQRRSEHEDGEISDGGASTASSKVARGFSTMGFGRDDGDIR